MSQSEKIIKKPPKIEVCACGADATHKRAGRGVNAKPWECKKCYEENIKENS